MKPYYEEAGIKIYHGDCRQILPQLGKFDLLLTDPPYGLADWGSGWKSGNCGRGRMWDVRPEWDETPTPETIGQIVDSSTNAILWGGNYFVLPPQKGWLIWDKCADMTQAQAELAWTNLDMAVRVYHQSPLGVFGNGGANGEHKKHPTQKPLSLIKWCLSYVPEAKTVLDPFCGSGTTLVAAKDMGLSAVGIEAEERYCEIAANRLRQEVFNFG